MQGSGPPATDEAVAKHLRAGKPSDAGLADARHYLGQVACRNCSGSPPHFRLHHLDHVTLTQSCMRLFQHLAQPDSPQEVRASFRFAQQLCCAGAQHVLRRAGAAQPAVRAGREPARSGRAACSPHPGPDPYHAAACAPLRRRAGRPRRRASPQPRSSRGDAHGRLHAVGHGRREGRIQCAPRGGPAGGRLRRSWARRGQRMRRGSRWGRRRGR